MRMNNPSMVPSGPGMAPQGMVPGSSGQMHQRVPRPATQSGEKFIFILFYYNWLVDTTTLQCVLFQTQWIP